MMYWIVFALFSAVESLTDPLGSIFIPFYSEMKILLLLYLSLSAGWSVSSVSPGAEILAQDSALHQTFSRGILNKYFGSLACSI